MIVTENIQTLEGFKKIKKGDILAIEWHRDSYFEQNRTRFATYVVVENKERTTEIILQKKNNIYFNYMMFLDPKDHGQSNCKTVVLIQSVQSK